MKKTSVITIAALLLGSTACGGVKTSPTKAPIPPIVPHATESIGEASPAIVCATSTEPAAADRISRIEIRGARVSKDLCAFVSMEPGQVFDEARIDAALRALWADGRVEDVAAFREVEAGLAALVYEVRMRPSVVAFEIPGFTPSTLPAGLSFERPEVANPAALLSTTTQAEQELREAGWFGAKVGYEITRRGEGEAAVVIHVEPGARAIVQSVRIEGPSKARALELASLMRTRASEAFDKFVLERDVLVLQADGYDRGLIMTKVDEPEIVVKEGGAAVEIVISMNEGAVFRIGKVTFEGDLLGSRRTYERELWTSAPAGIFSRKVIAADIERIRAFHETRGSLIDVTPETQVDAAHGTVDITIRMTQRR